MSTQRRENRLRPTGCMERAEDLGHKCQTPIARFDHAHAKNGTAPPGSPDSFHPIDEELSLGTPDSLATNSLQSDYRNTQLVRLVSLNFRRGSPPPGVGRRAAAVPLASFGSSLPHIPSGLARLHPSLPRVPVAECYRTERYDGKRDLYLQHAA